MLSFDDYIIENTKKLPGDTLIFRLKPKNSPSVFHFSPGQFCQVKNPLYAKPEETHLFSIASSPVVRDHLELCIKIYGFWTQSLLNLKEGNILQIAGPFGRFIFEDTINNAVFLAGGIGITPMISMLRYIAGRKFNPNITLLYGSRTKDTIAYKEEIDSLRQTLPRLQVIHILSHLKPEDIWPGYRGFITREILQKEVNLSNNPVFFICGPPVFVLLMKKLLSELNISENNIRQELFT